MWAFGRVGYGEAHCTFSDSRQHLNRHVPSASPEVKMVQVESVMQADRAIEVPDDIANPVPMQTLPAKDGDFRPRLKLRSLCSSSSGHGGHGGGAQASSRNPKTV